MDSLFTTPLIVVTILFPVLATVSVVLRLYARKGAGRYALFSDDWIILATLFFCWVNTANTLVGAGEIGVNKAKTDIIKQSKVTMRTLWIEGFLLATALALVKISILLFYYRIFVTKCENKFKYSAWAMCAVIIGWWISSIVCQALVTDPIRTAYDLDPMSPVKYRYNYDAWSIAFAAMSLAFDVIVLFYPLPVIGKLRIDFKRKLSIMGIFWLGTFCCVAAAVRLYFLYAGIYKVTSSAQANPYQNITNGFIWAHIEPNCSIIAACLPTYGTLFSSGRSAHSLIRSVRSIFSLSGRTNSSGISREHSSKGIQITGGSSQHSLTKGEPGIGYYELREQSMDTSTNICSGLGKTKTRVTAETTDDIEAQRELGMGNIGVKKEVRSERYLSS